ADRNRSHWSTSKTPSYTKSVSWQHHRRNGHRDTVINYLLCGQKWQSTITDYIFFHSLEGEETHGNYDNVIEYVSSNNCVYQSAFAEYIAE
ncbi:DUF4751 family protein, partial [Citrobacter freundii]|nr:DUF4751 family protein [Citrobacter freundii]